MRQEDPASNGRELVAPRRLRTRAGMVIGVIVYCLLLRYAYAARISPSFGYLGYVFRPAPMWSEVLSLGLAVAPALWLPRRLARASVVLLWLVFLLAYVPSLLVPQWIPRLSPWEVVPLSIALFTGMAVVSSASVLPLVRVPDSPLPIWLVALGLMASSAAAYALLVASFGVKLSLPSLADAYATRADYKQAIAATGPVLAYSLLWLGKVVNPLAMALGLVRRSLPLFIVGVVGQIALYAIGGQKAQLLSPLLLVAIGIAAKGEGRPFGLWLALGAPALVVLSLAADAIIGFGLITSLFVRRLILTPGLLSGLYFEYFREHSKTLLAHGALRRLSEYSYAEPPPELIGRLYLREGSYANANFWADGYAGFGLPGVIGVSVFLALVLWAYDSASAGQKVRLGALLIAFPAFALANSALLTSLLSHGLLFSMLVLVLVPASIVDRWDHDVLRRSVA